MKMFLPPTQFGNLSYLSWAFQLNVDCYKAGPLVLAPLYAAMTAPLVLSVGPAASVFACTAAFVASMATYMLAWVITCAFSFFCQSTLLKLPCVSLPYWDCLLLVCLSKTTLYLPS